MDAPVVTPAPAPASDPSISAGRDAANRDDFSAFDKAHVSAKRGTPLPDVASAVETVEAPAAAPVGHPSSRQRSINEAARKAAEEAIALKHPALVEENTRLKAELAKHAARVLPDTAKPPAAPAPPMEKFQTIAEYTVEHPEASLEDYFDARNDWRADQATKQAHTRATATEIEQAQQTRVDTFVTRLTDASTSDPEFAATLTDDVKAIKPFGALAKDEPSGPRNILGELIYDSAHVGPVLKHLSLHPDALAALETMPPAIAALPPALRVGAHIQHIVKAFGVLEASLASSSSAAEPAPAPSTITAAPPPAPTLTRAGSTANPKEAALKRGDFPTWEKLDTAERLARKQRPSA